MPNKPKPNQVPLPVPEVKRKILTPIQKLLDKYLEKNLYWYSYRIDVHFTHTHMVEFARAMMAVRFVVGNEVKTDGTKHSHIVVGSSENISDYKQKKLITDMFHVSGSSYSKSKVRTTVHRTVMYALKDGDYLTEGFSEEYILLAKTQSTKKFKKEELGAALKDLETLFYQHDISYHEFARQFLHLKIIDYGQKINPQAEQRYLSTHLYRTHKTEFELYVSKTVFLSRKENSFLEY